MKSSNAPSVVELAIGAVAALVAIATTLTVLPSNLLPPQFLPSSSTNDHMSKIWPLPDDTSIEASDGPNTASSSSPARRVPYRSPKLRAQGRLEPSGGSKLTPNDVAAERQPKLVRGWLSSDLSLGLQPGSPDTHGTPTADLSSLLEWSVESRLRTAFEGLALVRVKAQWHSPIFKLSSGLGPQAYDTFDGLPMSTFMDSTTDPDAPYCYYTAPLADWSFVKSFQDATRGWRFFEVKDAAVTRAVSKSEAPAEGSAHDAVAMLWLSQPGVTAHAHFDKSHNFLTQVLGRKRVLLWSPKQWRALYPHDEASPHRHQSQVDFDAPDILRFPSFETLTATEVILEPGDVLYIPPFWWHRIETMSPPKERSNDSGVALSMSVVSPSAEEAELAQGLWHPLPFLAYNATQVPTYLPVALARSTSSSENDDAEESKHMLSTTVKAVAMQTYLAHLLTRLEVPPRLLVKTLRAARYDPAMLQREERLSSTQTDHGFTGLALDDLLKSVHKSNKASPFDAGAAETAIDVCTAGVPNAFVEESEAAQAQKDEHARILIGLPKRAIMEATDGVAEFLKHVRDDSYPEELAAGKAQSMEETGNGVGIVEHWLIEYADMLARWALGIPQSSSDQTSAELLDRFTSACLGEMDVLPTKKSRLEEKWEQGPGVLQVSEEGGSSDNG